MKPLISILLLVLLTCQLTYQAGVIIYWKLNQAYITKALCENRDKPAMHCNGSCYLEKQLKKAAGNTTDKDSLPVAILKLKTVDYFIIHLYRPGISEIVLTARQQHILPLVSTTVLSGYLRSILHPPQCG